MRAVSAVSARYQRAQAGESAAARNAETMRCSLSRKRSVGAGTEIAITLSPTAHDAALGFLHLYLSARFVQSLRAGDESPRWLLTGTLRSLRQRIAKAVGGLGTPAIAAVGVTRVAQTPGRPQ